MILSGKPTDTPDVCVYTLKTIPNSKDQNPEFSLWNIKVIDDGFTLSPYKGDDNISLLRQLSDKFIEEAAEYLS